MKRLLFLCVCSIAIPLWAAGPDLTPSATRAATIDSLKKWVRAPELEFGPSTPNPFSMAGFEASAHKNEPSAPASDENNEPNLLGQLAESIPAKGRFVMGGEVILLIGNKKYKQGERVPVTHSGLIYELELTAIQTTKFTVRYRGEEFTRPINLRTTKKTP